MMEHIYKLFCWHNWTKWSEPNGFSTIVGYQAWSQIRSCTKCNKFKRRVIT